MHSRATDGRSASQCQGKWPSQPPSTVQVADVNGIHPHRASVLQEGGKSANIRAVSGFIWGIRLTFYLEHPIGADPIYHERIGE